MDFGGGILSFDTVAKSIGKYGSDVRPESLTAQSTKKKVLVIRQRSRDSYAETSR